MKSDPTPLIINKKLSSDPMEIATKFNTYFSNIASILLQGEIHHKNQDFNKYLTNRNEYSFCIKPTDKYEAINLINNLSYKKVNGPHSVPTKILHLIKFIIADPLSGIINLSFNRGTYFENLKISKVIPTYKEKGSNLDCGNHRPISLLSNLNKIIEQIMFSRLYNFLSIHNCIYNLQFGFRKYHSTSHALVSLTEEIGNALDNNSFAYGVFIDLQKAFDTVGHKILLRKLNYYGIRGKVNDWFKSYLSNRKQFVSINVFESNEETMKFEVPQGSVLGPLLFLIYINDLHIAIKYCTVHHSADDTNIPIKNKSLKQIKKQLNLDLRNLNNWLKANKISLNASKTELLIFRHPNKKINYDLKIKIDGKRLIPSKYIKYLGIVIDEHLNWNYHVDTLAPKLARAIGMLMKVRHLCTQTNPTYNILWISGVNINLWYTNLVANS